MCVRWNGINWLPLVQANNPLCRFRGMWRSVRCYHLAILLLLLLLLMRRRGLDKRQLHLPSLTADSPHRARLPGWEQQEPKWAHGSGGGVRLWWEKRGCFERKCKSWGRQQFSAEMRRNQDQLLFCSAMEVTFCSRSFRHMQVKWTQSVLQYLHVMSNLLWDVLF